MKKLFTLFLLCFFSFSMLSQNTNEKKQVNNVSKYSIKLNKNTKEKSSAVKLNESFDSQSFNFNYSNYLKSDEANKDYNSLLKAYFLNPSYSELYFELAKYYELKKDKVQKKEFCKKLQSSNLTPAIREYAYNTLMSVEQNGILVTYGEEDTYPIWILQTIENVRTDVRILNYNLLMNKSYRDRVRVEIQLKFSTDYPNPINILRDVAVKNRNMPVYYSLTVSHLVLKELKGNLYSTGLALKYSKSSFDNSAVLKTNWETKFSKSYITSTYNSLNNKQMNINYVLPLLQLSNYYAKNNMESENKSINTIIRQVGKNAGKEKQIEALLAKQQ